MRRVEKIDPMDKLKNPGQKNNQQQGKKKKQEHKEFQQILAQKIREIERTELPINRKSSQERDER